MKFIKYLYLIAIITLAFSCDTNNEGVNQDIPNEACTSLSEDQNFIDMVDLAINNPIRESVLDDEDNAEKWEALAAYANSLEEDAIIDHAVIESYIGEEDARKLMDYIIEYQRLGTVLINEGKLSADDNSGNEEVLSCAVDERLSALYEYQTSGFVATTRASCCVTCKSQWHKCNNETSNDAVVDGAITIVVGVVATAFTGGAAAGYFAAVIGGMIHTGLQGGYGDLKCRSKYAACKEGCLPTVCN